MMYLIGLGLDKGDLSMNAMEAIKQCKKIWLETYTSILPYRKQDIEKLIGKEIFEAGREQIESRADELITEAKKSKIALLVSGDPLAATTHIDLLLRARKARIKTRVIHAPSVLTAVAESGLQLYKFGKTASIPKFQQNYEPESFYDIMLENLRINAHTLMLLDIGLDVKEALSCIRKISEKRNDSIREKGFVVCSLAGTEKSLYKFGKIEELLKQEFKLPACIILPASLHFLEAEMLGVKA
ncbi:MAG: diphthine synthase [archaeon]